MDLAPGLLNQLAKVRILYGGPDRGGLQPDKARKRLPTVTFIAC